MKEIMESLFDVAYLITVITLGILTIRNAKGRKQTMFFGLMALVLGGGDAFHLVPRVLDALFPALLANPAAALGTGKMITSITMTVFYVLLYHIGRMRYRVSGQQGVTALVYLLAAVRVALCFFPQNGWTSPAPSLAWGIYRNIPFALLGITIIFLYYAWAKEHKDKAFKYLWLAVTLSFAFYAPVVLWAEVAPAVGVLMIPKTCAYVWVVWMGYRDSKRLEAGTVS